MTNSDTNSLTKSLTNDLTNLDTNDAAKLITGSAFIPYDGSMHEAPVPDMLYTMVGKYYIFADGDYFEFVHRDDKSVKVYKLVEIVG